MTRNLLACVETRMREAIGGSNPDGNAITRAALDHLSAGGSRIRARLSLDASLKLGLGEPDSISLASICELLHNASLIQDDLVDRAPFRRGQPSVWAVHSDSTAICAGDLLLASAFALIGDLRSTDWIGPVLNLVHRRTREVILGQGLEQSTNPKTLEDYEALAIAKSASLLCLPLELSLLVGQKLEFLPVAERVARAFATAYQMTDDLDDYLEDVRTGSLNVISVVLLTGNFTFDAACALVHSRIEALVESLIVDARVLPMGCGGAMIAHAETMRTKLRLDSQLPLVTAGLAHHAG
jgi:geranylgeranyl pyrophosphate synthase